jgi:hypothetical protein
MNYVTRAGTVMQRHDSPRRRSSHVAPIRDHRFILRSQVRNAVNALILRINPNRSPLHDTVVDAVETTR